MKFFDLLSALSVTGLLVAAAPAMALDQRPEKVSGPTDQGENIGVHQFGWPTDSPVAPPVRSSAKALESYGGVDFMVKVGEPIYAAGDGQVISVSPAGVVVYHGKRLTSRYTKIRYVQVQLGQTVKRGDVLGRVAAPKFGERSHFHFQVTEGARIVDPMDFLPAVDPKAE